MKTELLHSYSSNSLANLSRVSVAHHLRAKSEENGEVNQAFEEDDSKGFETSQESQGGTINGDINDVSATSRSQIASNFCSALCRRKTLYKKLPILRWIREYSKAKLLADIIAGLTVGLTILPQGLAYAKVAGLPPQYGLYSSFIGCFVYIFLGGSKVVTIGPTAIMGIITFTYIKGKPVEYAVLLCLSTGVVTFLAGVFQLGFITNFISSPTLSAFSSAAALTICSTQIKPLLGLSFKADGFREIVFTTFDNLGKIRRNDALLSVACAFVLIFMQNLQSICKCWVKNSPRADRVLWFIATSRSVLVLFVCTVFFSTIGMPMFPVEVVGEIVPGLPPIQFPPFKVYQNSSISGEEEISLLEFLKEDMSAFIVLPLLALMEHITIAKKFSGTSMLDSSQEMITIGVTNIVGSFFSSMPVTGSFSRSTVNAASGAKSPLGGLITGTIVILSLQLLTPYFYFIPNASLAAVIVCAVIFTVDFRIVVHMWKSKRIDLIPWGITFFVSLFVALEIGILCGIVVSVGFLLYYSARPGIQIKRAETSLGNEFVIVVLDRSLTFPSMEYIRYMVTKSRTVWAKGHLPIVIDCHHIQFIDFTAAQGIRDLFSTFNESGHVLILWKAKPSIIRVFKGLMDNCRVPFQYCMTEEDLERVINGDVHDKRSQFHVTTIHPTGV